MNNRYYTTLVVSYLPDTRLYHRSSKELFHYRVGNVWFSHKHHKLCTFVEKGRFRCCSGSLGYNAHHEK